MIYYLYTDAATDKNAKKSAYAYLIMTETIVICTDYCGFTEANICKAESFAVRQCLNKFLEYVDVNKDDKINIYSDSLSVVKFLLRCKKNRINKDSKNSELYDNNSSMELDKNNVLSDISDMISKINCNININKVSAHTGVVNPNGLVDRLAKTCLHNFKI